MKNCLFCYLPLVKEEIDFHKVCSKRIFGQALLPALPYGERDLENLAKEVIQNRTSVTGVQSKISMHISNTKLEANGSRFTIVGLWGGYILKPPTPNFEQLPEVEDVTMHLASIAKIKTAKHSLIRLNSGNLAYITKRMDRSTKEKLGMEDMCQITGKLTEQKYQGSYEQIAKAIQKYSATGGLDIVYFFELVLFSFLTGNADMHLKNFSLLENPNLGMVLSPAYDLVNTALVNTADEEEMALNLNGKKKKLKKHDFISAMNRSNLDSKQQNNIFLKMENAKPKWLEHIDRSFMSKDYKKQYKQIVQDRFDKIS